MCSLNQTSCLTVDEIELAVEALDADIAAAKPKALAALAKFTVHANEGCTRCVHDVKLMQMISRGGEKAIEKVIQRIRRQKRDNAQTTPSAATAARR